MSDCRCLAEFPERAFKSARDADDFMSRVRLSPVFRFVATDEGSVTRERYRCRTCGRDFACTIPADPPYTWAPLVPVHARPADPAPVAAAVGFMEVGNLRREVVGAVTALYEDAASGDVPAVLRTLFAWRPGLKTWAANANLLDVEIELGPRLPRGSSAFEPFADTWSPEHVNPAWKSMRAGNNWRSIHIRGVRTRTPGSAAGFAGEHFLVIVDVKRESVMAWMMREVS